MGSCFGTKNPSNRLDKSPKKLTNVEKSMLLANTNFNLREIEEWHIGFLKDCPSGKLNKKQFIMEYKKFNSTENLDEFCEHLFRIYDHDKNGYIDFQEFLLSVNLTSSDKNYKKKLEWTFKLYDIDGNGCIDQKEFKKIINSIFKLLDKNNNSNAYTEKYQDQRIKELFNKIDVDKNKNITLDEFVRACCRDQLILELLVPSA